VELEISFSKDPRRRRPSFEDNKTLR